MSARVRNLRWIAMSGAASVIVLAILCLMSRQNANVAPRRSDLHGGRSAIAESSIGYGSDSKHEEHVLVKTTAEAAPSRQELHEEEFDPTISGEDFKHLLCGIGEELIDARIEAWRKIGELSNREKIHWLGEFVQSEDESLRLAAMKATRVNFGMETFRRKTKSTYKDMKAREAADGRGEEPADGADAIVPIDMSCLPTKSEAAQINRIVRMGFKDESPDVRHEAVLAASSFDVDTCHVLFQYAMNSCSDDVRLDILRDAEYGDDDYRLRLQMAALDVGGDEVVKIASDGIEKATGRRFANSAEAFEWYEENRTTDTPLELVIGEPEE